MKRETLFRYVRSQYKAEPEYLWGTLPNYAVFRHQDGNKWFALVMNVPGAKLGLNDEEEVDVLEIKVRPEHTGSLRKKEGILPAYHMNKEHWISVLLSGPLSALAAEYADVSALLVKKSELMRCFAKDRRLTASLAFAVKGNAEVVQAALAEQALTCVVSAQERALLLTLIANPANVEGRRS